MKRAPKEIDKKSYKWGRKERSREIWRGIAWLIGAAAFTVGFYLSICGITEYEDKHEGKVHYCRNSHLCDAERYTSIQERPVEFAYASGIYISALIGIVSTLFMAMFCLYRAVDHFEDKPQS